MSPKVFLTGSTGYIGGSILHTIYTAHPDWSYTVLLRNVPATFSQVYPNITIIQGTYESTELIIKTAQSADIVIHSGNSDHISSLKALITGLQKKDTPCYLIHLSGTGIISDYLSTTHLGQLNSKTWSDTSPSDLHELRSLPSAALHRATEELLHSTIAKQAQDYSSKLNIAIMCPPDIYGPGLGLGKTISAFAPIYLSEICKLGHAFYHASGENTRSWVHINDLMRLYLSVVECAANGTGEWNSDGYYFASTQEYTQRDVAWATGRLLKDMGIVEHAEPRPVALEELDGMLELPSFPRLARYLFASNARTRAERAGKLFGYTGKEKGLLQCLEHDYRDALKKGEHT